MDAVVLTISADSDLPNSGQRVEQGPEPRARMAPFVAGDFTNEDYAGICQILREQKGFFLDGYKDLCIKRRIAARIRAVGLHAPEEYIALLKDNAEEQERLLTALTVHVSHFFRNPSTYAVLERRVLPELLAKARQGRCKVRIWSVGCSCGEEPYSIAMLCRSLARKGDQLSIIATDLSSDALQRAKQGCFRASRLAEVPASLLQENFNPQGGSFQLVNEVRQAVRFFRHDILSDPPLYRADLILCRNLLIYFSRGQQQEIIQTLAEALTPGGYLVLGRAETLMHGSRHMFTCVDPAERIYRRLEDEDDQLSPT